MKFSCSVDIELPIESAIELFDNSENLKKWQPDLINFEHLEGEPRQVGSQSKMVYRQGKSSFDLFEEITVKNLPEEMSGYYDHKLMRNSIKNGFVVINENNTRWNADLEYEFKTTLWKFLSVFMKGAFKKQTLKFMMRFKDYAEAT